VIVPSATMGPVGWKPLPGHDRDRPRPVSEGIERVLRHLGAPSADVLTTIVTRWPEIVGEQIAGRAVPVTVHDGRLTIRVEDPAWASQLRWLEQEVVDRIGALVGRDVVNAIEVRVGEAKPGRRRSSGGVRSNVNPRRGW
jgi:predicted nucleic acid-binding Zn ribbon protein